MSSASVPKPARAPRVPKNRPRDPDALAVEIPPFDPVPRRRDRHDGWTEKRQRGFIDALADSGSVTAACAAVGMSTVGAYQLRRQPGAESFRAAWDAALDCGLRILEAGVIDRAVNGVEVPILSAGKSFGTRRVFNERVNWLILQTRLPEKYGLQRARGMSALDQKRLEKLKAQWRLEIADELVAEFYPKMLDLAKLQAESDWASSKSELSIMRNISASMHVQRAFEEQMSPSVRAAWDAYNAAVKAEKSRGAPNSGPLWRDGWEERVDRMAIDHYNTATTRMIERDEARRDGGEENG